MWGRLYLFCLLGIAATCTTATKQPLIQQSTHKCLRYITNMPILFWPKSNPSCHAMKSAPCAYWISSNICCAHAVYFRSLRFRHWCSAYKQPIHTCTCWFQRNTRAQVLVSVLMYWNHVLPHFCCLDTTHCKRRGVACWKNLKQKVNHGVNELPHGFAWSLGRHMDSLIVFKVVAHPIPPTQLPMHTPHAGIQPTSKQGKSFDWDLATH
jgi:hypothetical protein